MRVDESGNEWVMMTHAGSGGEAEATRAAFDEVWKDKGWTLKDDGKDTVVPVGDIPANAGVMRTPEAAPVNSTVTDSTQEEVPHG